MVRVAKNTPVKLGRMYGRLTVLQSIGRNRHGKMIWRCLCRCGNVTQVIEGHLKNGHTRSCGCLHEETIGKATRTHGRTGTRTYRIWKGMKIRCKYPSSPSWKYYGALGISYDPRWETFEHFLEDMGEAPVGYSLDRLDGKSNYSKANCRWASLLQQNNNKASNRTVTFRGITKNMSEWARELGFKPAMLFNRLYRGWSIERAFTTPKREPF